MLISIDYEKEEVKVWDNGWRQPLEEERAIVHALSARTGTTVVFDFCVVGAVIAAIAFFSWQI